MYDENAMEQRLHDEAVLYSSGTSPSQQPFSLAQPFNPPAKLVSVASDADKSSWTNSFSALCETVETVLAKHRASVPTIDGRRESPVFRALALVLAMAVWIPVLYRSLGEYCYTESPEGEEGPCYIEEWKATVLTAVVFLFLIGCVLYLALSTRVRLAFNQFVEYASRNRLDLLSAMTWVLIVAVGVYGAIRVYRAAFAPAARVKQPNYEYEVWQAKLGSVWDNVWNWIVGSAENVAVEQAALATGLPVAAMTLAAFPVGFISAFLSLSTNGWCAAIAAFGQMNQTGVVFYSIPNLWIILVKARIALLYALGMGSGRAVQRGYAFLFRLCRRTQAPKSLEGQVTASA